MNRDDIPFAKTPGRGARQKETISFVPRAEPYHSPETAWDRRSNGSARNSRGSDHVRIAAGLVVLLCFLGSVAVFFVHRNSVAHRVNAAPLMEKSGSEVYEDRVEAMRILAGVLDAKSIPEALRFVRMKENISDLMVQYSHWIGGGEQIERLFSFSEATEAGRDFLWCNVRLKNSPTRTAVFERTEAGLRLDWESFVHHNEMPWKEFLDQEVEESRMFRIVMMRDDYYAYAYADNEEFKCFKIQDALGEASCWGYCPVDSVAYSAISALYMTKGQEIEGDQPAFISRGVVTKEVPKLELRVVLKLKFEVGEASKGQRQVLIEELVSESWLLP